MRWVRIALCAWMMAACGEGATSADSGSDVHDAGRDSGARDAGLDAGSVADAAADAAVRDGGSDAGAADGGHDAGSARDAGAPDAGSCTPESASAFCARLGAECGSVSGTDDCGDARTESCGACTGALTCGGGSASANECGCSAPPDVTGLTASCSGGSPRVSFTGSTTVYAYAYRSDAVGPAAGCALGDPTLVGSPGPNTFTLPGGPGAGQCGTYLLCAYEPMCDADFSAGRLLRVCVDSVGMLSCTVTP